VLLLHGLGSSSSDWSFQWPAFAPTFRLLAVDLRGHGRSRPGPGRVRIEALAEDVAALLAHLGEGPVHVLGLSLGGCVALALALRAPERVRSLVLINAFARLPRPGPRRAARLLTRLALLAAAPMRVVAAHVARGLFPRPEQQALYEAAVASLSRTPRRAYFAAMRALAFFDAEGQLSAVRCPTLVVAGDRDFAVPRVAADRLARGIPGARLHVIADSGHASNIDQPEALNRAVLEFLSGR
jgi:pimeloyl-ACP methyl ester carboxylesterase